MVTQKLKTQPVHNCISVEYMADETIGIRQKLRKAFRSGYALPPNLIEIARRLYNEGQLEERVRKYHVVPYFYDPFMRPVIGLPGFEQNPNYPREYPRRINKQLVKNDYQYRTESKRQKYRRRRKFLIHFYKRRVKKGRFLREIFAEKAKIARQHQKQKRKKKMETLKKRSNETQYAKKASPTKYDTISKRPISPDNQKEIDWVVVEPKREFLKMVSTELIAYKWAQAKHMKENPRYFDPIAHRKFLERKAEEQRRKDEADSLVPNDESPAETRRVLKVLQTTGDHYISKNKSIIDSQWVIDQTDMNPGELASRYYKAEPYNQVTRFDDQIFANDGGPSLQSIVEEMNANAIFLDEIRDCKRCIDDLVHMTVAQEIIPQIVRVRTVTDIDGDKYPKLEYLNPWNAKDLIEELSRVRSNRRNRLENDAMCIYSLISEGDIWWTVPLEPFVEMLTQRKIMRPGMIRSFKKNYNQPMAIFKMFLSTNMSRSGFSTQGTDRYEYFSFEELRDLFLKELQKGEAYLRSNHIDIFWSDVLEAEVESPFFVRKQKFVPKRIMKLLNGPVKAKSETFFWRAVPMDPIVLPRKIIMREKAPVVPKPAPRLQDILNFEVDPFPKMVFEEKKEEKSVSFYKYIIYRIRKLDELDFSSDEEREEEKKRLLEQVDAQRLKEMEKRLYPEPTPVEHGPVEVNVQKEKKRQLKNVQMFREAMHPRQLNTATENAYLLQQDEAGTSWRHATAPFAWEMINPMGFPRVGRINMQGRPRPKSLLHISRLSYNVRLKLLLDWADAIEIDESTFQEPMPSRPTECNVEEDVAVEAEPEVYVEPDRREENQEENREESVFGSFEEDGDNSEIVAAFAGRHVFRYDLEDVESMFDNIQEIESTLPRSDAYSATSTVVRDIEEERQESVFESDSEHQQEPEQEPVQVLKHVHSQSEVCHVFDPTAVKLEVDEDMEPSTYRTEMEQQEEEAVFEELERIAQERDIEQGVQVIEHDEDSLLEEPIDRPDALQLNDANGIYAPQFIDVKLEPLSDSPLYDILDLAPDEYEERPEDVYETVSPGLSLSAHRSDINSPAENAGPIAATEHELLEEPEGEIAQQVPVPVTEEEEAALLEPEEKDTSEPELDKEPEPEKSLVLEVEAEPEVQNVPEVEAEADPEVETDRVESEVEPEQQAEPELVQEPADQVDPEVASEVRPEVEEVACSQAPEVEVEVESDAVHPQEAETEAVTEVEQEAETEPETEVEPEAETEPVTEVEPEAEMEPETEVEPETEHQLEPENPAEVDCVPCVPEPELVIVPEKELEHLQPDHVQKAEPEPVPEPDQLQEAEEEEEIQEPPAKKRKPGRPRKNKNKNTPKARVQPRRSVRQAGAVEEVPEEKEPEVEEIEEVQEAVPEEIQEIQEVEEAEEAQAASEHSEESDHSRLVRKDITGFYNEPEPIQDMTVDVEISLPIVEPTVSIATTDEGAQPAEPTNPVEPEVQYSEEQLLDVADAAPKEVKRKRGRPRKKNPFVPKPKTPEAQDLQQEVEEAIKSPPAKRHKKSIETVSVVSERSTRSKRLFLSKNNPVPRVRVQSEEPVEVAEPVRLTGVARKVSSDEESSNSDDVVTVIPKKRAVSQQMGEDINDVASVATEELDIKPELVDESWVAPAPHTETSRKSKKTQRKERQEAILNEIKEEIFGEPEVRDEELEVLMIKTAMKQELEEEMEECMIVQANYKVHNDPVENEQETVEPRVIERPAESERPTHKFLLTKRILEHINELFMSDPQMFCTLSLILKGDSERKGRVFKSRVEVVDRTSSFSEEFINYLATSPRIMEASMETLVDYNCFSSELRQRTSLLLADHQITPLLLHRLVDRIIEIKKTIREGCPRGLLGDGERDSLNATEQILLGRYIESVMKLTALSQVTWATEGHVKRRLELIYYGWKMFLSTGGFFRIMLSIDREDVKPMSEKFRSYCVEYLKDIEDNFAKAVEYFQLNDDEILEKLLNCAQVSPEQLSQLDADVRGEESETHSHRCSHCFISGDSVYFSTYSFLEIHEKLHEHGALECTKCYDDFIIPEIIFHRINYHFSLRLKDDDC